MPVPSPELSVDDVHRFVRQRCFEADSGVGRVGAEVEWLVFSPGDLNRRVPLQEVRPALADVVLDGAVTFEPGGQLEISSPPEDGVGPACAHAGADMACVRRALAPHGLALVGLGLDPLRPHHRVGRAARYVAMETYFDARNTQGRAMMCGTASIQVNLDLGPPEAAAARWRLAHQVGPTLAAAFANSPFADGRPSGWRSSRLATWARIDACRTAPVLTNGNGRHPPADGWARYALDACVMLVRDGAGRFVPLPAPLPFGRWLTDGHELGYPTEDDLAYHLTTLFPPVRPRGWLELRMIDALPDPWWRVAVAVTTALLDDPEAAEEAGTASAPTAGLWVEAARHGLGHPALAASARRCFAAALSALPRLDVDAATEAACAAFVDGFVDVGRSPADELLGAWALDGGVVRFQPEGGGPWT